MQFIRSLSIFQKSHFKEVTWKKKSLVWGLFFIFHITSITSICQISFFFHNCFSYLLWSTCHSSFLLLPTSLHSFPPSILCFIFPLCRLARVWFIFPGSISLSLFVSLFPTITLVDFGFQYIRLCRLRLHPSTLLLLAPFLIFPRIAFPYTLFILSPLFQSKKWSCLTHRFDTGEREEAGWRTVFLSNEHTRWCILSCRMTTVRNCRSHAPCALSTPTTSATICEKSKCV